MMHEELVVEQERRRSVENLKSLYPGKRIKAVDTAAGVVIMLPRRARIRSIRMWQLDDTSRLLPRRQRN